MSSNDWSEQQEQLRRTQQAREAVNQALILIQEDKRVSRRLAIALLADLAQSRHRRMSDVAADVLRTGRLPDV